MNVRFAKTLKLGASVLPLAVLVASPAFAQSTGTQQIETVVVTGAVTSTGLLTPLDIPKERSVITQDFINTQPSGQTVFESLNIVPGLTFEQTDPYGNSGGTIRLHGMDGNRISLTWDGMPLNDTGNYATFTNQVVDTEIIDRVSVNQGTTDVDSPTASATGGVINIRTTRPADHFAVMSDLAVGSFRYKRAFFRIDSGDFGPWGTRAFFTYSYNYYNKFKGPGNLQKNQLNADIYQDMGDLGWMNLAVHFNRNRNDFYNAVSYIPMLVGTPLGAGVSRPAVALDANGSYAGDAPATIGGFGMGFDEDPICNRPTPVFGTAQSDSSCTGFYHLRVNPSDTGNIRFSSLWHLMPGLVGTLDANFQYVLANGGGFTNVSETDAKLRGATPGPVGLAALSAAAAGAFTVPAFGCVPGVGCDLNGDGDLRDSVGEYTPNNTNTRRYGLNAQLIYSLDDNNTFQAAYVLDWGLHRQTGQWSTFNPVTGPADFFGGLRDAAHRVNAADGFSLRQRDRKSYAILNQFSLAYEGHFFADMVRVNAGLRLPFFQRDLNQYCYNQTTGFAYCTTEAPVSNPALAAQGLYQFNGAGATNYYTAPGSTSVTYSRALPNAGIAVLPFGPEHQFFFTYAQGISVPRTDNLYNGGTNGAAACAGAVPAAGCVYTTFALSVRPETTATYDLGYRFQGEWTSLSVTAWNTQYRNRIVSTFDQNQGISIDHNIGTVNMDGVDVEGSVNPMENLDIYASASYLHSRVAPGPLSTIVPGTNPAITVSIAGKEVVETPNWTFAGRVQYKIAGFRLGLGGKFIGRRFATDTNDFRLEPNGIANADVTYDLGNVGLEGWYAKFNVTNLFDSSYFTSIPTTRTCFTPFAPVTVGCTSAPLFNVGAPRTVEFEIRSVF
ncbi:MAG: TonB-dependent receptor [Alphaproteobacteria bacterium]|nr:TonB-dependent receptor [Alphaproteobacteria bacterium]MBV9904615.1 TonB-dependent receptor [Alphaproteobacteria bacterium]